MSKLSEVSEVSNKTEFILLDSGASCSTVAKEEMFKEGSVKHDIGKKVMQGFDGKTVPIGTSGTVIFKLP